MLLSKKKITPSQAIYIVNRVLIPRLEYRLKITILNEEKYHILFQKVYKMVKHKFNLPSTAHTNILTHKGIGNLKIL